MQDLSIIVVENLSKSICIHSISNDSATKHIAFHAHGCPILGAFFLDVYKTVLITHTSYFTEDKTANILLESEVC